MVYHLDGGEENSNKIVITTIGLNSENQLTNISSSTLKQKSSTWLPTIE